MSVSTEINSLSLVRCWILEHASKFGMRRLLNDILKRYKSSLQYLKCFECAEKRGPSPPVCLNPNFLTNMVFCEVLEMMRSLLRKGPVTIKTVVAINTNLLVQSAEMLESLYSFEGFIPFADFSKLQCVLKLLSLIVRLVKGEDNITVMQQLNELFPSYSEERVQKSKLQYRLKESEAKKYHQKYKDIRIFVVTLTLSEAKRHAYFKEKLMSDVKNYLECGIKILPEVIEKGVKPYMPLTTLEKLIEGGVEDLQMNQDPTIQLLLQFLQPPIEEIDLVTILNALDPTIPITTDLNLDDITGFNPDDPSSDDIPSPDPAPPKKPLLDSTIKVTTTEDNSMSNPPLVPEPPSSNKDTTCVTVTDTQSDCLQTSEVSPTLPKGKENLKRKVSSEHKPSAKHSKVKSPNPKSPQSKTAKRRSSETTQALEDHKLLNMSVSLRIMDQSITKYYCENFSPEKQSRALASASRVEDEKINAEVSINVQRLDCELKPESQSGRPSPQKAASKTFSTSTPVKNQGHTLAKFSLGNSKSCTPVKLPGKSTCLPEVVTPCKVKLYHREERRHENRIFEIYS